MPVNGEAAVVSDVEWQSAQPTRLNRLAPFCVDAVGDAGVGGAERRMNAAKFTTSDDISEAVPNIVPKLELVLLALIRFVASSGVELNTQPATAARSFGNSSLDTPCSTLYASPEKMSNDLFCAFQPKRVTVPSLPLVFRLPPIPSWDLRLWFAARFACRAASGVFSTRPSPKVGVGMR